MYIYIYWYIWKHIYVCAHIRMYMGMYVCRFICICIEFWHVCIWVVYTYACAYVYVYVCLCSCVIASRARFTKIYYKMIRLSIFARKCRILWLRHLLRLTMEHQYRPKTGIVTSFCVSLMSHMHTRTYVYIYIVRLPVCIHVHA